MHTPPSNLQSAQASGLLFLSVAQACSNLRCYLDAEAEQFLVDVQPDGWYPLVRLLHILDMVSHLYTDPAPVLEHIGIEMMRVWYDRGPGALRMKTGVDFLRFQTGSECYHSMVQGAPEAIGTFELVSLDAARGKAMVWSSTPLMSALERGMLRGGMSAPGDLHHFVVDNTDDENVYMIDFAVPTSSPPTGTRQEIDAHTFMSSQALGADQTLSGPALQEVFARYKALEAELQRQKGFWQETNNALSKTLLQLRDREKQLQETTQTLIHARTESELVKEAVVDVALDAVITITETSEIIEFNASAERIFGYRREDVLGKALSAILIPDHLRQAHYEGIQRYLATGVSRLLGQRITTEALRADGRIIPVELSVNEIRLAQTRMFTAYVRDITERERMERALRESERQFRSLAEAHPVPIGIVGVEARRWLYVSTGLAELVGCPVDELMGQEPVQLFADVTQRDLLVERLSAEGTVGVFEFTLRKSDGTTIPVAMTAKRCVYEGMPATVGGIWDLTEKKQAEEEIARQRDALYQNEKLSAIGSLLAAVAHELNNPLAIVVGRSIMLEQGAKDPATATAAGKIREAAERCTHIVKTFLAMARRQEPERTPTRVNELITNALELVDYSLRTSGVETQLDLAPDLPDLLADDSQLHQVFTNLFVNAQQALLDVPEPRILHVTTRYDSITNGFHITVTDNGPGIPPELQATIFEPFYTTKPVGAGTGVGLSLSSGIIASHGGSIRLETPAAGGTRFVVTLPYVPVEASPDVPTSEADIRGASSMVLIVDDEPDFAEMLSDMLIAAGHHTRIALSGNAALACLAEREYDIMLSDIHMADLNGPALYQQIQRLYPHMLPRLAFITGDTLGAVARRFLDDTDCPYLEKPCAPHDVLQLIHTLQS